MPAVSGFEYLEDLHLVRLAHGPARLFYVGRPYTVGFRLDGDQTTYTVPEGMGTDLASIPKLVPKWIADKIDGHIEAAVVHDHLCIVRGPWDSRVAADIFNEGMRAAQVPAWRREIMYRAVVMFGPQW